MLAREMPVVHPPPPSRRRDESGLTTLEWLLIVAAVAGIAALAVVLVQGVVSDTSEQISGSSARRTAAEIAAADVQAESRDPAEAKKRFGNHSSGGTVQVEAWGEWKRYFEQKCKRIEITYGDAGIKITDDFVVPGTPGGTQFVAGSFGDMQGPKVAAANCEVAP